jgi:hypothetical protein
MRDGNAKRRGDDEQRGDNEPLFAVEHS